MLREEEPRWLSWLAEKNTRERGAGDFQSAHSVVKRRRDAFTT
jgi:hypothetical protein